MVHIDSEIKKLQYRPKCNEMVVHLSIYRSIGIYIYGSQYKSLTAIFSGSTERNLIKLGQCGEGMSTK